MSKNVQLFHCSQCSYMSKRKYNVDRHTIMVHQSERNVFNTDSESVGQNVLPIGQNVLPVGQNVLLAGQNVLPVGQNVLPVEVPILSEDVMNRDGVCKNFNAEKEKYKKIWPCSSCYKEFTSEKRLLSHHPKCKHIASSLECPNCHRMFSGRNNLSRHRKNCQATATECNISTQSVPPTQTIQNITNNINNGTINNIHVHINGFGNEDLRHISMEFANECFRMGGYGVQPMLDKIYFNTECPENHNVRLVSLKNRIVEVFKETGKWDPASLMEVLEMMLRNSIIQIMSKLDQQIIQPTEEVIINMNSIQNMKPVMKRRIHESTRGKLVARRKNEDI